MELQTLDLTTIDPPSQADRLSIEPNALNELALSMRDDGLMQPIVVRPISGNRFEIVAGHRRYLAAKSLNWPSIDSIIRHDLESGAAGGRFAENIHREQLTPMEEALSVARLANDAGLNSTQIAAKVKRSLTWVQQRTQLLDLDPTLKELVHAGDVAVLTALHLNRVTDDAHRAHLLKYTLSTGASSDVIRQWVREWETNRDAGTQEPAPVPELPEPGQAIVIMIPCYICRTPTDHRQMLIVRLCRTCHAGVNAPDTPTHDRA